MITRRIPSTNEPLPVIGLGTWQCFDVPLSGIPPALPAVLDMHRAHGGRLIDSSPMYGNSEKVIGRLTKTLDRRDDFFYATKVWTTGREAGIKQMQDSMDKMGRSVIDLMQIHNLLDWRTHLKTLRAWKEEGRVRYIGITHYTDDSHQMLEQILREEPLDFVQFNYSIFNRHAEARLLPVAADLGVATLINRPLGVGSAFSNVLGKSIPTWASDYSIHSWSQYFLKFIISHPAVTCVIPATGNPVHMADNAAAGLGEMPDSEGRVRMANYLAG
jgi:diketogulonate reductase-like aldo/keto reductase